MELPSQLVLSPVPSSHSVTSTPRPRTQVHPHLIPSSTKLIFPVLTTDDGNLIRFPEVDEQRFFLAKRLLTQGVSVQLCGEVLSLVLPSPGPPLLPSCLHSWSAGHCQKHVGSISLPQIAPSHSHSFLLFKPIMNLKFDLVWEHKFV